MNLNNEKLDKILLFAGYIKQEDIEKAKAEGYSSTIEYLRAANLITKDLVGQAISEHYKLEYADLNTKVPSKDQVLQIPKETALNYRIVVFENDDSLVTLATDEPAKAVSLPVTEEFLKNRKFDVKYSLTEDLEPLFDLYKAPLEQRLNDILSKGGFTAPDLLKNIFTEAIQSRASDIHFDPVENEIILRFRIDGVLHDVAKVPKLQYEGILNKIKIDSQLRIDKHNEPLDGAIRFNTDKAEVDLRISIVPTINGEKIVIRLLSSYIEGLTLDSLGLTSVNREYVELASNKPYGMIIVAGPTGSGKTTTLYSLMKLLNKREVNITTIEDPVEYRVQGINQIQVNQDKDITFSRGLRSIVRQDPDVIMVGEIRDFETADIGINASLTGHLLLTSFHANNAAATIPRLMDMGIEPFLAASTIEVIVAQRLVRKICENCKYSKDVNSSELSTTVAEYKSYFKTNQTLYFGKGCDVCAHTGYKGRTGIFEVIKVTKEMKDLIARRPTGSEIWKLARKQGSISMFEDGIDKVKSGITTIEELVRVAQQAEY